MSSAETSRRFKHVGLISQQRRLRHLKSLSARNISRDKTRWGTETLMETYFSLHVNRSSDAFYTSEKIQDSLNPTWRSFDLCRSCPEVNTSRSSFVVKVWGGQESDFKLIIEWKVDLKGLRFVGTKIHKDGVRYQANSIIFGMFDGFYSSPDNLQESTKVKSHFCKSIEVEQNAAVSTYNTYALARLHTTQRAIRQTEVTVAKVRASIIQKLSDTSHRTQLCSEKEGYELRLLLLREEIRRQRRRLEKEKEETSQRGVLVQHTMDGNRGRWEELDQDTGEMKELKKRLAKLRDEEKQATSRYTARKAMLVKELAHIYLITQLPSNLFAICGAPLPNAESNIQMSKDDPTISTSLGHTSHLILMISRFLQTPLRYPITYNGSRSTIHDHITEPLADKDRDFPLYTRGKEKFHYNYAVYLLNRNIAQLRYILGLSTTDLRLTLPNLLTLLELKWGITVNLTQDSAEGGTQPVTASSKPVTAGSPQSRTGVHVGVQASVSPNPPSYSSTPGVAPGGLMDNIPNSPPPPYHVSQAAQQRVRGLEDSAAAMVTETASPVSQGESADDSLLQVAADVGDDGLRDSVVPTEVEEAQSASGDLARSGNHVTSHVTSHVTTNARDGGGSIGDSAEGCAAENSSVRNGRTATEGGTAENGAESGEGEEEEEREDVGSGEDIGIGQPNYNSGDALSQDSLDVNGTHIGGETVADLSSALLQGQMDGPLSSEALQMKGKGESVVAAAPGTNNGDLEHANDERRPHNQSNSNNTCRVGGSAMGEHSSQDSSADFQAAGSGSGVEGDIEGSRSVIKGHDLEREVPFMAVDHIFRFDDISSRADALSSSSVVSSFKSNNSMSSNRTKSFTNS